MKTKDLELIGKETFTALKILPKELLTKANSIAEKFDLEKKQVSEFGVESQMKITEITRPILEKVKVRDLDSSYDITNSFISQINGIDLESSQKAPGFLAKIIKSLDPWVRWLKSLINVDRMLDNMEKNLININQKMNTRIAWFRTVKEKMIDELPNLYTYAAAAEIMLKREQSKLEDMEQQLTLVSQIDPGYKSKVDDQRAMVSRIRTRVLDLHETALTAYLIIPTTDQSMRSAEIINDSLLKSLRLTIPKIRLILATIIAQRDIKDTAEVSIKVENADLAMTKKLGESLGTANTAVEEVLNKRREKIEALRDYANELVTQIQRMVEINKNLEQECVEAMNTHGDVTKTIMEVK
jgi:hypothetical protein